MSILSRINDSDIMALQNSPVREAEFEWSSIDVSSYKKWIHVPVYQFYRVDDNSSKKKRMSQKNEPKFVLLKSMIDIVPIWISILNRSFNNII